MSIDELIRRVEGASGPDRELDGCIWWATLSSDQIEHFARTGYVRECIARDGSAGIALAQFYDSSNPACLARIAFEKRYTASLDAAMTLIGDDHWRAEDHPLAGPCAVVGDQEGYAATVPLALTAAALRARALASKPAEGEK